MEETSGVIHDYLGLTIDFLWDGKVVFSMFDYLEDIIVEAPVDLKDGPRHKTPESKKLFNFDKDSPMLCQVRADLFHQLLAWLLFASKRA